MKKYFYFPSTFFGFVGRGYGRKKRISNSCGCGYLARVGKGGSYSVVRIGNAIPTQLYPATDYYYMQQSENSGLPVILSKGMDKAWTVLKDTGKETVRKSVRGIIDSNPITRNIARIIRNPVGTVSDFVSDKIIKYANPLRWLSGNGRGRFKKGSTQARLLMAKLRAMRKARGSGIRGYGIVGMGKRKRGGNHLKKGSAAAKLYMAKLRAMRRK